MIALISAFGAVLGTLLAVGIAIGIGRLVVWVVPPVPHPDPLTELWQEREVRAGRFPDGVPGRRPRSVKRKARR